MNTLTINITGFDGKISFVFSLFCCRCKVHFSFLFSGLHQYSHRNCSIGRKSTENWLSDKKRKKKTFSWFVISHILPPLFQLVSALHSSSNLSPLLLFFSSLHTHTVYNTHTHMRCTTHTSSQFMQSSPPLIMLWKTATPTTAFVFLSFFGYSCSQYFSQYFRISPYIAPHRAANPSPLSSLLSCFSYLCPAWCVAVGGGVLTQHWVCLARSSTAAGGPVGSSWVGVWWWRSAALQPVALNTNLKWASG